MGALSFDAGQRALIQFADKMLDNFSVEDIEGGLQHGLVLRNIHYQSEGIDTQIAQANLQLDFNCLFSREICLRDVTLSRPTIAINTALLPPTEEEQSTSKGMQRIYITDWYQCRKSNYSRFISQDRSERYLAWTFSKFGEFK